MGFTHWFLTLLFPSGGFRGAYDPFAASIVHAYEPARRVLSSYTGPLVRLRRASDNAEADFGYLANGDLNVAAIAAWAGGASNVVTVCDQAAAGDNVTQAVAGSQPVFTASAKNGHAGMTFDGTADGLQGAYTTGGALSQPVSFYTVAQLDATAVNDNVLRTIFDGDDATDRIVVQAAAGETPDRWLFAALSPLVSPGPDDANWHLFAGLANGVSGNWWLDTVQQTPGNAGANNPTGITIGMRYDSTANWWKGPIVSVIVCDPSHSDAQRAGMQNAMNAYWGVF